MKQIITLALDRQLLKCARALAAARGSSVSRMLADELRAMIERETGYERAKARALTMLESPIPMGGAHGWSRDELHDCTGIR